MIKNSGGRKILLEKNSRMFPMNRTVPNILMKKVVLCCITTFILMTLMISMGGCSAMLDDKDTISELSFSHDGKKVVFDRCRNEGCQIQVYDLETGELAAYQSPKNERWTMGKYSYDGKKIAFSVIPIKPKGGLELGEMQIAVMDADGKNFRKVTTGHGAKLHPAFSHSGKKVLYARAAHIREKGRTPAAQYDAWEVDLAMGAETQLTFFEYYYLGYLTYFPDDERFIYWGEMPGVVDGVGPLDESNFKNKMIALGRKGISIAGVAVMKGKEQTSSPYQSFPNESFPQRPLLNKDGSVMIYEKSHSGDFYLYSDDGNHRRVCRAGSVDSVAISPDGEFFGTNRSSEIFITRVSDGVPYRAVFVRRFQDWDDKVRKNPSLRLLPEQPLRIINR